MKKIIFPPVVTAIMLLLFTSIRLHAQVRIPTLYVTGTVSSDEKMLVTVRDTKYIEGKVVSETYKVSTDINGKKTEVNTDREGHALLDFSKIATGLINPTEVVIKSFDKKGNLVNSAKTMVYPWNTQIKKAPVLDKLPANLSNGEALTIHGQHLGAGTKFYCGDQVQETLASSDKEMIVFPRSQTGEQSVYVTTPNGVSQSQKVNIYTLGIELTKSSITPLENVQAMVHFESIPVGTKLIFTNLSPETINMTVPGGQNSAYECIYTVAEKNGSLPVNITGLIKGDFRIALNTDFVNEKEDSPPVKLFDEEHPGKNEEQPEKKEDHPEKPPMITINPPKEGDCPCIGLDLQVVETEFTKSGISYGAQEELLAGLIKVPHLEIKWFNKKWDINKNEKPSPPVQGPRVKIKYQTVTIKVPFEATLSCDQGGKTCQGGVEEVYFESINIKPTLPADYNITLNNTYSRNMIAKCGDKKKGPGSVLLNIKIPRLDIKQFAGDINLVFKLVCENNVSFVRLKIDLLNGKLLQESFEPWSNEKE